MFNTREDWLLAAVKKFRQEFVPICPDFRLPEHIHVSVGFPLGSRKAIGQCFPIAASEAKVHAVFISPVLDDVAGKTGVLATLLHELCHACLPPGTMHKAPFAKLAASVGLVKPWTATTASDALLPTLVRIADELGAYPHSRLNSADAERKKQTTRLIKLECLPAKDGCGLILRASLKAIAQVLEHHDEFRCPDCAGLMEVEIPEQEG